MASFAAKIVSKKILGESLQNKFGTEDPYFETLPATRLGKPTGKYKKRKKALPPGISDHDGKILTKVKRRAYRLDLALCSFLGVRFGWGSVIGLVPAIGDALDAFMALMVFKTCCQIEGGLPSSIKLQMIINVIFDFAVGLVPFLGDLADAVFKANTRNCLLLEQHLREKGKKQLRKSGLPLPAVDPSAAEEYDKTGEESPSDTPPRRASAAATPRMDRVESRPSAPVESQGRKGRSWFGRNKSRPHDVEAGPAGDGRSGTQPSEQRRGSRR
ncbi:hypothetical protein XA68_16233 [Ophiocordyceps unilateralis]|uniref:PH domain-containing protein n=1 Tax=Ophiocordyceps unilateralis TaxID=268505 RepID=A0A2A9PJX7_OPHUN|nr:hypothetical protein XA68_16233 [Ophiocordyceps unilateralis]